VVRPRKNHEEATMNSRVTTAGPLGTRLRESSAALRVVLRVVNAGPPLILVILVIVFGLIEPIFVTQRNIQSVAIQSSLIGAVSLGMFLVILTGGIDLSVGSVIALSTVLGAVAFTDLGWSPVAVVAVILATGVVIGALNGAIYVKGRIPHSFISTLAMMGIAHGVALIISDGLPSPGMPDIVQTLGGGYIGPFPVPALVVLVLAGIIWFATSRLVWGQWVYAVGGNAEAAREVGIPVDRVLISVYVACGACAAVAGLIMAGRTNSGFPMAGNLAEMDAIAGVIIGGVSFLGGRGTAVNAVIGAVIVGVIRNGLNIVGVNTFLQYVAVGCIIIMAVEIDVLRSNIESRLRAAEGRRA